MGDYFATDSEGGLLGLVDKKRRLDQQQEQINHWPGDSYGWWE